MTTNDDQVVNMHYGQKDLGATILAALSTAGKNPEMLRPEDLAPVDQFHIGGKQTTLELIRLASLQAGMKVLDVGGGLGGAARTLAIEQACQVTVLDLTEEYCRVGEMLTARTGLSDRVSFQQGSALDMPFPGEHFDAVWTQHSSGCVRTARLGKGGEASFFIVKLKAVLRDEESTAAPFFSRLSLI
jgi:MPBQ/MSBQ methyltransferase